MSKILFYLILKPVSYLPYWLLYGFSDFLSFVFFTLIPYRKKVVISNLRNSFPHKTELEINTICRAFYSHFSDLIVESIKLFSITQKEIDERFVVNLQNTLPSYFQNYLNSHHMQIKDLSIYAVNILSIYNILL